MLGIIIIKGSTMSSLNVFQQFVEQEVLRGKMELTNPITAILDYL